MQRLLPLLWCVCLAGCQCTPAPGSDAGGGPPSDAATPVDAGALDAAAPDATAGDASALDGAGMDGAAGDGSMPDGGAGDAAVVDASQPDAASGDGGVEETCGNHHCAAGESAATCSADCAVTSICAGTTHACASLADGTVRCWGSKGGHRMGGSPSSPTAQVLTAPGLGAVVEVACAEAHTCLRTEDGEVFCFGRSGHGEAGVVAEQVFPPRKVTGVYGATGVTVGRHHSCAMGAQGRLWCWGSSEHGESGRAFSPRSATATMVMAGASLQAANVSSGEHHTCSVALSGFNRSLYCFGLNTNAQLGLGTHVWKTAPAAVTAALFPDTVTAVGGHTCVVIAQPATPRQLKCWGRNNAGQLGDPHFGDRTTPFLVPGIVPSSVLSAGDQHTCVVDSTQHLFCFGANGEGQLGDNTTVDNATPQAPYRLTEQVRSVSAGATHTCAVTVGGKPLCWGNNRQGQTGRPTTSTRITIPATPQGL